MSIDEIKMLDIAEQIMLVEDIWDSIAKEEDGLALSDYEKKLLDERLSYLKNNSTNIVGRY